MLLHLVKKEFLLVKPYILILMFLPIGIPLFISGRISSELSFVSFIYTVVFTELMLCQAISMKEAKYPKAAALLCAAPYPRSAFVKAKYLFFLLLFAYCYVVYSLIAFTVPGVGAIDVSVVLVVLLLGAILYGIYLPLDFKYGFEKTRFLYMIAIFSVSFGVPALYNFFSAAKIDVSMLASIPTAMLNSILVFVSAVVLGISMRTSIKIYAKKEL